MSDYKKKYNETLEAARYWHNVSEGDIVAVLEEIFPELCEPEDEQHRKWIIEYLYDGLRKSDEQFKDQFKCAINWLEKQKHLENYDEAEKEKDNFVSDGFIKCYADFLDFKEGSTYWLEYIGDDKYNVRSDNLLGKTYHITPCQLYTVFKKLTWIEKQSVQNQQGKSAREAIKEKKIDNRTYTYKKPIFNAGEWITHNIANFVFKVVNVGSYGYEVVSQQNFKKTIPLNSEDKYRLWSIEDAKPGDVIYCESGGTEFFIILKDISKSGIINSYCRYNDSIGFGVDIPNVMRISDNPKPATKEQRDFLFQKMKESGYEWSEETHELKEIELIKNESEEELSDFEAALFSAFSDGWQQYLHGEEVDVAQWAKEHSAELLKAANQNYVAWNKDDEVRINRIVALLENLKVPENDILIKDTNWLKYLKYQKQWKPTDDQLADLKRAIDSYTFEPDYLEELYEDLKKLKEE